MAKADIAALLALASALCVAIGDVLQQRATHRITDTSVGHLELFRRLLGNRRWRCGAVMPVVSIGLQAAALNQGSVLLVQALLVLSLLFALPISARSAGRSVTAREWAWAVVLTPAVTVVVTVGNPQAGHATASLRTWATVAAVLAPVLAARGSTPARRGTGSRRGSDSPQPSPRDLPALPDCSVTHSTSIG